ncbi:hypothetical protein HA075_20490 [bacterium BFN5]|nr:hypothetical protein HA075_20490 [bacterium BFN5]
MMGAKRINRRSNGFLAESYAGSVFNKCRIVIRTSRMERYLALLKHQLGIVTAVCEIVRKPLFIFKL